jgi:hypothetical protein
MSFAFEGEDTVQVGVKKGLAPGRLGLHRPDTGKPFTVERDGTGYNELKRGP